MTFAESKAYTLKRKPILRVFNALGMIAWREECNEAQQKLRLVHPLAWVWLVAVTAFGVLAQGIPETIRDIRYCLKHNTVWI